MRLGVGDGLEDDSVDTAPVQTVPLSENCAGEVFVPENEPLRPNERLAPVATEPL